MNITVTDSAKEELNIVMENSSYKKPGIRIQISGIG